MTMDPLDDRVALARYVLSIGVDPLDLDARPNLAIAPESAMVQSAMLGIPFPVGLNPTPKPISPEPQLTAGLPQAEVVVITWTVAEQDALADVLTPGYGRLKWHRYAKGFDEHYRGQIRKGAPSLSANPPRLGSYMPTMIGTHSVLCIKSELHLNQDGISTGDGTATLPVRDFFNQIIAEVQPKYIATIGTAGSVYTDYALGDVVVTRAAKFRCCREFRNETFNHKAFTSNWEIPTNHFAEAEQLMQQFAPNLEEPPFVPPTVRYTPQQPPMTAPPNKPKIRLEGRDMPEFHPILTTDYFEFGTSTNHLDQEGAAVEMGDAVLGLVCSELPQPPKWVVVRNMSDPQINGALAGGRNPCPELDPPTPAKRYRLNPQTMWAVAYYTAYGYHTSVAGALATWAIIAGLP